MARNVRVVEADFSAWYDEKAKLYGELGQSVSVALRSLLSDAKIEFVSVNARLKDKVSCLGKLKKKDYEQAEEMTDIAGLRVITYLQEDVNRVLSIIKKEFQVIDEYSVDKDLALGVDKVGYRSKHYVCALSTARLRLKENARFKGMKFEIQVRTALQHAWAEIEHDRNYKFGGKLPDDLKRRLNLVAGLLEIADLEFDGITNQIRQYQRRVAARADKGDLAVEINSLSATELLSKRGFFDDVHIAKKAKQKAVTAGVVAELESFGLTSLAEVNALLTTKFVTRHSEIGVAPTGSGFLRRAMLFSDPEKYFSKSQVRDFKAVTEPTMALLIEKVGRSRAHQLVKSAGLRVLGE